VLNSRAEYRMASAGKAAGVAVCDDVLTHEIEPALALCRQHMEALGDKVKGNTLLGEVYGTQGRILQSKRDYLLRDMDVAEKARKPDLLKAQRKSARETNLELAAVLRRATAVYERVLGLDTSNMNARLTLARFALRGRIGRPKRAKLLLEPVLKEHPENKEAIKRMAEAEHMEGNEKAALAMVRRLSTSERTDEATLFEAEVLIALKRWKDADELLRAITKVLAEKPDRVKLAAAFLHGKVLRKLNRSEEAANFLQNIFSDPKRKWAEARYELALALQEAGLREQAIAAYELVDRDALASRVPNVRAYRRLRETLYDARTALARAWRTDSSLRAGRYASRAFFLFPDRVAALDLARESLLKVEKGRRMVDELVLYHVAWLGGGAGMDAAEAACERELKMPGAPVRRLRGLLGRLYVRHGSYAKATGVYEKLWKDHPDDRGAALELARMKMQLGAYDEALKVYEQLEKVFPKDISVVSGQVAVLLAKGQVEKAWEVLKPYGLVPENQKLFLLLLRGYVRRGRTADAIAVAKWRVASVGDSESQAMLGEVLLRDNRLTEARAAFEEALRLDEKNKVAYTLGLLELAAGRYAEAVRVFRTANERFPNWFAGGMYLALALEADGRPVEAVGTIEGLLGDAREGDPQWDLARWFLAIFQTGQGRPDAAREQDGRIVETKWGLAEDRARFLERLAGMQATERSEAAQDSVMLLTFSYAGLPSQARGRWEKLEKRLPGDALTACWLAQAMEKDNRQDEARAIYRKVMQDHPGFAFARIALAGCCDRAGDRVMAIRVREEALGLVKGDTAARMYGDLAKSYETEGQVDMAIENYEAVIAITPRDVFALNNLAWLLATRKGDAKAALGYVEKAVEAGKPYAPHPVVMDTMGWAYYLNGDYKKAVAVLERAKGYLGRSARVRYHLGMTYVKLGRRAEAKSELEEALKLFPDSETAAEIEKALGEL